MAGVFRLARVRRALVIVALPFAVLPAVASADSLVLASHQGGVYNYNYVTSGSDFPNAIGTMFVLSGLSGVSSASLSGPLFGSGCGVFLFASATSTSVTVSNRFDDACVFSPGTYGTLQVNSTVTTPGTVNWTIENNFGADGNTTGTTQGPVSQGNSANAKLCQKNGWQSLYRSTGEPFASQDDCVAYAAKGGTLMP